MQPFMFIFCTMMFFIGLITFIVSFGLREGARGPVRWAGITVAILGLIGYLCIAGAVIIS